MPVQHDVSRADCTVIFRLCVVSHSYTFRCYNMQPEDASIFIFRKFVKQFNPLKSSGHYMYRTVVTVCTAQCSLYVPYSGHYMYRTVVTIRTAQWSLYVPHSGHYMYRQFNIQQFYVLSTQLCFVWTSEQTAIISLYNINWLVFITERECLLCGTDWGFISG